MSDRALRFLILVLAALLVAGTGVALRYARGYRPLAGLTDAPAAASASIGLEFQNVRVVGRQNNRPAWIVTAGRIVADRGRNQVDFTGGIHAQLLRSGQTRATLTAPQANYQSGRRLLNVSGTIVCDTTDPRPARAQSTIRLETNQLLWEAGAKQLRCPGPVRATMPGTLLTGEQVTLDLVTRALSLKNVLFTFDLNDTGELPL